jgi:hypothetical protein
MTEAEVSFNVGEILRMSPRSESVIVQEDILCLKENAIKRDGLEEEGRRLNIGHLFQPQVFFFS